MDIRFLECRCEIEKKIPIKNMNIPIIGLGRQVFPHVWRRKIFGEEIKFYPRDRMVR